jgi:hypothetical protein
MLGMAEVVAEQRSSDRRERRLHRKLLARARLCDARIPSRVGNR